jgi:hypothetical protein
MPFDRIQRLLFYEGTSLGIAILASIFAEHREKTPEA